MGRFDRTDYETNRGQASEDDLTAAYNFVILLGEIMDRRKFLALVSSGVAAGAPMPSFASPAHERGRTPAQ